MVVQLSRLATRSAATRANRYEGLGQGSCHSAQWLPSSASPVATSLPFDSSTGNCSFGPSMRTVKVESTSGRSGQKAIRRKPSASHWVQSIPFEA